MSGNRHRALLIGCHGGVGRALLAVLHHTEPGRRLRNSLDALMLVDRELPAPETRPPEEGVLLPPTAIESSGDLCRVVTEHAITQVIDVSSIDTVDCTKACDELGADFLCTSVEEWAGRGSMPTDEAIARLLPPLRPTLERRSHLVGSGANPGIVNALVFMGLAEFASRVGVPATVDALELSEVLITEEDTTVERDAIASPDVFAMTWSPRHCLEELFEPAAFCARDGRVISLGHQPTTRWYAARCGDRVIQGMAVPHEEVVTLARHLWSVEIGFLYRIPPAARQALASHPDRTNPDAWETRRLCPPWTSALTGSDRVGVLLCSRRFGELWAGFDTDVATGLALGTNATQLQVAAGILAGWLQLGKIKGIHFVEDLNWREFMGIVGDVLGPPVIVHDASAHARSLADRRVSSSTAADDRIRLDP
jgi:hypothetical protein